VRLPRGDVAGDGEGETIAGNGSEGVVQTARPSFVARVVGCVLAVVAANLVGVLAPTTAHAAVPKTVVVVVSGDGLAGLTLSPLNVSPTFSTDIRDYAVRCRAGVNLTTLRLRATASGSISVGGASGHVLNLPMALLENQALVVRAPDPVLPSGPPVEYWVRCLPHDFPRLHVAAESGTAPPGWYLTANVSTSATSAYHAMVLDQHGTPVWYRPGRAINTQLLPGNTISWAPDLGPGFGADPNGAFTLFHLGTRKTSFFAAPIQPTDQHELVQLGNGHRLLIGTPLRAGLDLSVLGGAFATTNAIVDCVVEETDASGALVWEWRMSEHVDIAESKTTPRLHTTPVNVHGTSAADVYHCNSLDVGPSGNVLISSRHTSAVYLVDKTTGGIIWKLGGTPSNHDHAQILTIQSDPGGTISGQHDARFRPNGNVSLYDDHTGMTGPARGLEYAIDTTAGTATLVWQYAAPDGLPAGATGSFRRSADGNDNIVGWGFKPGQAFTEVDAAGNVLLDVTFPNGELTYRNVKEPAAAIDAGLLRRGVPSPAPDTGWQHLGGVLNSAPAAASPGLGRLDVFVRGTDNQLYQKSFGHGSWGGWQPLGGVLMSAPAVASQGAGRLDVFVRGTDNQLYRKSFGNGSWGGWQPLGGVLTSAPAVASRASGVLDVFVQGTDAGAYRRSYANGSWTGWHRLGVAANGDMAAASWGGGRLDLFSRDLDGGLGRRRLTQSGWHP
jgi:Arylsulfotransferase (ASST)